MWQSPMALITMGALAIGVIIVAYAVLTSPKTPAPDASAGLIRPPADAVAYRHADGTAIGSKTAPVTLDVYSDYQCPACDAFVKQGLPPLVNEFVPSGALRIVDHPVDILSSTPGGESTQAAVAAECANDQGKYWQYHDYLFWNQRGENQGTFSRDRLLAIATAVGLDRAAFETCIADPARASQVAQTTMTAGISSTPTLVLNGQRVEGMQSWNDLVTRVRAAIPAGFSPAPASAAPSGSAP